MQYENDLILRATQGENIERYPVWLMRQAGRILPEYRALRATVSGFKELVSTPELAAEVTIQPVDLLGVDAAIIFSDILVVPEAMGLPYEMIEKKGPHFPNIIKDENDFKKIDTNIDVADRLHYVVEAIQKTKKELKNRVPLIGFAGAPWTIFCYMTEGAGSKTFSKAKKMIYQNPTLAHELLNAITSVTIDYLKLQIKAGADIVQIFDSWAGILGEDMYRKFGAEYIKKICAAISNVPVTVFSKGAHFMIEKMSDWPCENIGIDWTNDPIAARKALGDNKTIQGNLDPCALYADFDDIRSRTRDMLDSFGYHPRHIVNLGHGVYPDTDPDAVKCFIDTVKDYKRKN